LILATKPRQNNFLSVLCTSIVYTVSTNVKCSAFSLIHAVRWWHHCWTTHAWWHGLASHTQETVLLWVMCAFYQQCYFR